MTSFVLLHGAFRGAWSWSRVVPILEENGHDVHAPDLPGAGRRFHRGMPAPGLAETISSVKETFEENDLRRVVLAGHSQGGFIARAASQVLADRIAVLAYLDAPVPRDGESARDLMPGGVGSDVVLPEWIEPPPVSDGLVPEDAAWMTAQLTPVPVRLSTEPVTLNDARALALPERFAFCAQTPAWYPCWSTRARLDATAETYDVLDSGHDAPITAPALVANWLMNIVAEAEA